MLVIFEFEVLKVQVFVVRMFIVRLMVLNLVVEVFKGLLVDDIQMFQVYKSKVELKKQWGVSYEGKLKKIIDVVVSM